MVESPAKQEVERLSSKFDCQLALVIEERHVVLWEMVIGLNQIESFRSLQECRLARPLFEIILERRRRLAQLVG